MRQARLSLWLRAIVPALHVGLWAIVLAQFAVGCGRGSRTESKPDPLSAGLHTVDIGGSTIAYNVAGSDSGPVVFVHPGGPGLEWSYDKMPEVEKFAKLVYIEPIGTGHSSHEAGPRGFNLDRYSADIESLRVKVGLQKFVLLGHSHGGFVAQTYALAHQDHLNGLILYDTTPTTGPEWQKDVEAGVAQYKHEPWFPEAVTALGQETSAKTDSAMTAIFKAEYPLYFAEYTKRAEEFEPSRAQAIAYIAPTRATDPNAKSDVGVAPSIEVRDRLGEIHVPTLVIVGKKDFVTPEKYSRIIHDAIHDSRLTVLERSGHMGHMEQPVDFAASVTEFLGSLPR
jgi:proline iminopeptidase